jgi:5-methylcytosine-specific restriction endonuclease McrA
VANVHLEFQCPLLPKTPLKQVGKSHKKWMQTRKQWLEVNTYPVHTCHYCRKVVTTSEMTLDHKVPRSRAPELRYDFGNLVPACASCNGLKGSVDHDHYRHECPDIKTDHVKETT